MALSVSGGLKSSRKTALSEESSLEGIRLCNKEPGQYYYFLFFFLCRQMSKSHSTKWFMFLSMLPNKPLSTAVLLSNPLLPADANRETCLLTFQTESLTTSNAWLKAPASQRLATTKSEWSSLGKLQYGLFVRILTCTLWREHCWLCVLLLECWSHCHNYSHSYRGWACALCKDYRVSVCSPEQLILLPHHHLSFCKKEKKFLLEPYNYPTCGVCRKPWQS